MIAAGNDYAQAIFMLAQENGTLEEYHKGLALALQQFDENPEYLLFLASPNIPRGERISALEQAFGNALPEHVLSLLKLLCEQGKIARFDECVKEFEALKAATENTVIAVATSAVELSEAQSAALKAKLQKLNGKTVILENRIDPSVLGGIIVEMDGKLLDGSIKRQLVEVKEVIGK